MSSQKSKSKTRTLDKVARVPLPQVAVNPSHIDTNTILSRLENLEIENQKLHETLSDRTLQLSQSVSKSKELFGTLESQSEFLNGLTRSMALFDEQKRAKDAELKALRTINTTLGEEIERIKLTRESKIPIPDLNSQERALEMQEFQKVANTKARKEVIRLERMVDEKEVLIADLRNEISDMQYEVRQCVDKMQAFGHLKSENALLLRKLSHYENNPRTESDPSSLQNILKAREAALTQAQKSYESVKETLTSERVSHSAEIKRLTEMTRIQADQLQNLRERHAQAVLATTKATEAANSATQLAESSFIAHRKQELDKVKPKHVSYREQNNSALPSYLVETARYPSRNSQEMEPTVYFLEDEALRSEEMLKNFNQHIQSLESDYRSGPLMNKG